MQVELSRLKSTSDIAQTAAEQLNTRKKQLLVLILSHLSENGYLQSVEKLSQEAGLSLRKVTAADNISLMTVLMEYENYHLFKFGRKVKLTRKATDAESKASTESRKSYAGSQKSSSKSLHEDSSDLSKPHHIVDNQSYSNITTKKETNYSTINSESAGSLSHSNTKSCAPDRTISKTNKKIPPIQTTNPDMLNEVAVSGYSVSKITSKELPTSLLPPAAEEESFDVLLKPLALGQFDAEYRELAMVIQRDIFVKDPGVRWSDIEGLDSSKRIVKESVVFPMKYPQFFTGILRPWKGLLMFGPPGTGKTMLAKALASEAKTTFFNISPSSLVSKWRGDSEKLIRCLFSLARFHAPSTIFIDELDSLMGQRTNEGKSQPIKMDGLAKSDEQVFLLGASNLPWELDSAMLRRLEKRVWIPVPDVDARRRMFEKFMPESESVGVLNYELLSEMTHLYSGSDVHLVCREASMRPLRALFGMLEEGEDLGTVIRPRVEMPDVVEAIRTTKPTCDEAMSLKYKEWADNFGST